MDDSDFLIKVVLVGDASVGKSYDYPPPALGLCWFAFSSTFAAALLLLVVVHCPQVVAASVCRQRTYTRPLPLFRVLVCDGWLSAWWSQTYVGQSMPTIGVDFKIKTLTVDGQTVKLQIWLVYTYTCLNSTRLCWPHLTVFWQPTHPQGHSRPRYIESFTTALPSPACFPLLSSPWPAALLTLLPHVCAYMPRTRVAHSSAP